eukprot:CAMPEP_0197678702 /NCGR_PEP_ID=MMETSP1338-20131121/90490_1 /TAXON_ID=43686 ORGANISM="Pelagodinium beii, Strain RCC1491" /NCGR_SAMPLE_ID=MMETSP1338 /ASSEMBLY_ACC=CAM_ASM_000754 /LENGTH=47 /DNA_ID= /DNA_START= /DNA_END= /DNA_ORIENTATION=
MVCRDCAACEISDEALQLGRCLHETAKLVPLTGTNSDPGENPKILEG